MSSSSYHDHHQILLVTTAFNTAFQAVYGAVFKDIIRNGYICRFVVETEFKRNDLEHVGVLILYRCILGSTLALIRLARKKNIKVIYELDDDLLDPPLTEEWGRRYVKQHLPQVIEWFLAEADLVKAGSPELARRLNKRGYPNAVFLPYATELYRTKHRPAKVCPIIGYFGTPHHMRDINDILPALADIDRIFKNEVEFEFIGCYPQNWQTLKKATVFPYIKGYSQFMKFLSERHWTVGLIPLRKTRFNEAKSDCKFRDYTAAGIAGIYADLIPYQESVVHGENGWLCGPTSEKWVETIQLALSDPELNYKVRAARKRLLGMNSPWIVSSNWMTILEKLMSSL